MPRMRLPRGLRLRTPTRFLEMPAKWIGLVLMPWLLATAAVNVSNGAQITPLSNPSAFYPGATLLTFEGLQPFARPTSWAGVGFVTLDGKGPDVGFDPDPPREFGPDEQTSIQNILSGRLAMNMYLPSPMVQLGFEMRTQASQNINLTLFAGNSTIQNRHIPDKNSCIQGRLPVLFLCLSFLCAVRPCAG